MEVESKYTKVFTSDCITRQKYDELYELAISIREQKNTISKVVASDIFNYLDKNPLTFVTEMRMKYKGVVSSNYDKQLYQQVIDAYQNKFEAISKKIKFENVEFVGFEFYKRDTKNNKKGDLKKVVTKRKTTPLSTCLTYLARYGNDNTVEYINTQLASKNLDNKKTEFYQTILEKINKFGFDRLMKLALQRRDYIIKRYNKPIEFKSLTFSGRSRKRLIVDYNKNYTSKMCPICGCIEDENRPNQETFCCVECGHSDNADHNAAINIKNRVCATVLRQRLLKQLDNGTYKPLKLTKDKIKSVLLSYRTNNLKVVENL